MSSHLSLQPAIRQLQALGQHNLAGAFHCLASSIVDDRGLDDGVKELLLGHLVMVADFKAAELFVPVPKRRRGRADGPSRKRASRPRCPSPKPPATGR